MSASSPRSGSFLRNGDPFIWIAGSCLAFCLIMIAGLVIVVAANGLGFFWPSALEQVETVDGLTVLGEQVDRQAIPEQADAQRVQLKIGNRDVYGLDFRWIPEDQIRQRSRPADALLIERMEWGNAHGFARALYDGDQLLAEGPDLLDALARKRDEVEDLLFQVKELEEGEMAALNAAIEEIRLERRRLQRAGAAPGQLEVLTAQQDELWRQYDDASSRLTTIRNHAEQFELSMALPGAEEVERRIKVAQIVRLYQPNSLSVVGKAGIYISRVWEFMTGQPRESNTEGGIFPALFGTVMMVFLMTLAAVPFGVLAALYLREYARQGILVRAIRIAVNNLAGVPSIVFGMFGLGFFVYGIGGTIDAVFYPEALPTPTYGTGGILWASLTLALLTLPVVIVATEEALAAVPTGIREGSLALGSTKLQMIWRVVLPSALPGILTGVILATARGAGEVAPLMITGVVKLAPDLPLDGIFPFLHLERKFMHLGFHIYDVGFQSPNVEAARPMVYTTTFLLLMVVLLLNLTAIIVRNHLRKRYSIKSF